MIEHLKREHIDTKKWDACIAGSWHETAYGYSWYLDRIAPTWSGLVMGDYKAVMPLIRNRKWGISYILNVSFLQYASIFGVEPDRDLLLEFIYKVPKNIRLIDMNMYMPFEPKAGKAKVSKRSNMILASEETIEKYRANYNNNTKRNLKKADKAQIVLKTWDDPSMMISSYIRFKKIKYNESSPEIVYKRLTKLINYSLKHQKGQLIYAFDNKNNFLGGTYFQLSKTRMIYLFSATNPDYDPAGAMFKIVDKQLEAMAGKGLILDFEGSEIEGIARFYKGFGAKKTSYYNVKINLLPKLLQLIKG